MALSLSFSISERGDNELLTITDTTGTGTGGWGNGGNDAVTAINNTTKLLTLKISITTSDGTKTTYDTINLYNQFGGPFTTVSQLVFPLTCAMLKVSGQPLGTISTAFPDGIYDIVYTYNTTNIVETYTLIDGVVKTQLYQLLRTIPTKYEADGYYADDILDIIFMKGYYDSLIATAEVGRQDQVIDQLYTLQRLILNGSNYNW